jgi:hypothetical protein
MTESTTADPDTQAGCGGAVDRVDTGAPFGDDFQARQASLHNPGAVAVITADGTVELTSVFQDLVFVKAFPDFRGD